MSYARRHSTNVCPGNRVRYIDSIEPLRADLQRSLDQSRVPIQALDLARQLQAFQASMPDLRPVLATSQALEDAIRPLPDLRSVVASSEWSRVGASLSALSAAIGTADYIAELDFSDDESPPEHGDGLAEQAEQQLIEIAPAEALEKLQRVDFAPITLLDRVARDPRMMRALGARDFEGFVATLVEMLGFEDVVLTPRSGDDGRDVLATKRIHGISILCAFECKRYAADHPVGPDIARSLLGVITHGATRATKGILVTTSYFTPAANKFILTEPSLDGRDFDGIVAWLRDKSRHRKGT